jgi:hypothetical protein
MILDRRIDNYFCFMKKFMDILFSGCARLSESEQKPKEKPNKKRFDFNKKNIQQEPEPKVYDFPKKKIIKLNLLCS